MKKQILISSLIAAGILSSTGLIAMNSRANAEQSTTTSTPIAASTDLVVAKPINTTKNETVYVITDETGATKTRFIGSTIYDGAEELPFNFTINYYLNGQEISGQDLKGKSGHIKIVYHYNPAATYQGKYIPFLAITGVTLDHGKFSNIKVSSGKIISESSDNYIIAGYGLAGANQNLGTDFLPDTFSLEADTTSFSLENTYTIFTNDILADLDTSKLNRLDELTSSVYQLEDGINKLVNGATDLSSGLATALDSTKQLYDGSKTLADGLSELKSHNEELISGAEQIASMAPDIATLLQEKKASLTEQKEGLEAQLADIPDLPPYAEIRARIIAGITQIDEGIAKINTSLSKLSSLEVFYQGLVDYTDGVAKAATGATTISAGLGSLVEGETKLYEGSVTLKDGLTTFKTAGIDKLVSFASKDLANFTRNARATVNAAASYRSFGNADANSVKFIVKTPTI